MVLGVCRRVLRQREDAEDAFQATFLVLARHAASIRKATSLPSWLYGVAYRVARNARRAADTRQAHERKAGKVTQAKPDLDLAWRELQTVLAEEVQRLPEKLRAPFVLCCLEGKSKAEAAAQLGWKEGTVSGRLAQARQRMQQRLTRRGLTLSAVLCAGSLVGDEALALAPALVQTAIQAGVAAVAGQVVTVAAPVAALAEGVSKAMFANKVKVGLLLVFAFGLLSAGGGLWIHQVFADPVSPGTGPKAAQRKPADQAPAAKTADAPDEVFTYAGRVLDPDGKPLAGAKLYICGLNPGVIEFRERTTSGPDGTFRFQVRRDEFGEKGVVPPGRSPPEWYVNIGATADGCGAACVSGRQAHERENLILWLPAEEVVNGRVISLEGKPVAEVRISARINDARWGKDHKPVPFDAPDGAGPFGTNILPHDKGHNTAVTDKDGRFTLRGLGRGWLYDLSISGPTVVNVKAQLVARPDKPAEVGGTGIWTQEKGGPKLTRYGSSFTFVATPCKLIVGIVREKGTGKPIGGAEVRTPFRRDDEPTAWSKTAKDGKYQLTGLPAGVHTLHVHAPPHTPYVVTESKVDASAPGLEPVTHDIEVERQPAVTGRVTDAATGKPVKGWVEYRPLAKNPNLKGNPLLAEPHFWSHHEPTAAADGDGRFMLPVLRGPGVLLVRAESEYLPAQLAKADRVSGIADPADAELIDCRPYPAWPAEFHAYRLIDVPQGKDVEVAIALTPGSTRPLVVEFPDGKVHDTTVLGLKPVPRDHGDLYYPGNTTIAGLADGEARRLFVCTHDGQFAASAVVRGRETGPVTVKLKPTGAIAGQVVDPNGNPIRDVSFQMAFDDGPDRERVLVHGGFVYRLETPAELERSMRTRGYREDKLHYSTSSDKTDDQGRFRLTGVLPEVPFNLKVQLLKPPDAKGQRIIAGMVPITRATVKPGETLNLGKLRVEGTGPKKREPLDNGKPLSDWIKDLKDKDPDVRRKAAEAVGRIGSDAKAAVPALLDALEDEEVSRNKDNTLSMTAAEALWKVDRAAFVEVLKTTGRSHGRWVATLALWNIGPAAKEVTPVLVDLAKDQKASADQAHALLALGYIGAEPEVALPVLAAALGDRFGQYSRMSAAQALGILGPKAKAALPNLEKAMRDPDAHVRVMAAGAVWEIDRQTKAVIPVLTEALKSIDGGARQSAMRCLAQIGPEAKEAVPALLAVWQDPKDSLRKDTAKAVKAIDPEAAAKAGIR
jgi:RNA polymerase sigma factor (sigma-70 family)